MKTQVMAVIVRFFWNRLSRFFQNRFLAYDLPPLPNSKIQQVTGENFRNLETSRRQNQNNLKSFSKNRQKRIP
jgi:hypothetical protein